MNRRARSKARRAAGRIVLPVEVDEVACEEMLRNVQAPDGKPYLGLWEARREQVARALGRYVEYLYTEKGDTSPRG